ncbi:unnamed protein product [Adineta steineri]|uniref:Uncharacterized protein n=1 Tax=Adineta steineri TaxID=433720 RepID=A0A815LI95_9BILA|nr:unnamed protein product [Adineta steineri]CAF1615420.1 unnamed protein product [Adineta steineri]
MVSLDRILFALVLCFFGYVLHLPSGFAAPSQRNNDYPKEDPNDYCKNPNGYKQDICKLYCNKTHTINISILPSPLDQLNKTLIGQLHGFCYGFCYRNTTCFCGFASGQLNDDLSKNDVGSISLGTTAFTSTVVIGGKNITLAGLLCEDPR